MIFLISSQMELLFASSLLKLVRMGEKCYDPLFGPLEAGGPVTMNDIHVYGPQS
jgi:hypothetical protein